MSDTLKQPKALSVCFLTEMWERFGYIIIQTLLVFVLLQEFNMSMAESAKLVGTFTGVLFVTSVIAGYISDFFLGYLRSVIIGSIILFIGYLCISIVHDYKLLCLGLSTICIGTGLLKTNVSGFLGTFYEKNDTRRDTGFTIFYIGINVGPVIGAIVSTSLQNYFHIASYQQAFFLATFAVLLAGTIFYGGYKIYKYPLARANISTRSYLAAIILILASIGIAMWILYVPFVASIFFIAISVACIFSLVAVSLGEKEQIKKTMAYILFLIIGILYFSLYNQIFISINIFNDIAVNKNILGMHFSPQAFVSIDNIGVIIFGLLALKLWPKISRTTKFIVSTVFLAAVFLILLIGVKLTANNGMVSGWWVIASYLILAVSEICISPIGLALATQLSPEKRNGLFIGAWLVTIGVAGQIAGTVSSYIGLPHINSNINIVKEAYIGIFSKFLIMAIILFIITIPLSLIINKFLSEEPVNTKA